MRGLTSEQVSNLRCPTLSRHAFGSEAERRAAWEANRAQVMAAAWPDRRPSAYWEYDVGEPELLDLDWRDYPNIRLALSDNAQEREAGGAYTRARDELEGRRLRFLAEHGLLTNEEIATILSQAGSPAPHLRRRAEIPRGTLRRA